MDIANQFEKITISVTKDIFIASLKKMADEIVWHHRVGGTPELGWDWGESDEGGLLGLG